MNTASSIATASRRLSVPAARRDRRSTSGAVLAGPLRDLLLNSCLLAASRGLDDAVAAIRPVLVGLGMDAARLAVAIAMVQLRRGDAPRCLETLERDVLSREPGHELALAMQASAWRSQGRERWQAQAQALLATSADPLVRSIVQALR